MQDAPTPPTREKAPWALETLAVLVVLAHTFVSASIESLKVTDLSQLVAAMTAPWLIALAILGVASFAKTARTRRNRALTILVAMGFMLPLRCGELGREAGESALADPDTRTLGQWLHDVADQKAELPRSAGEGVDWIDMAVDDERVLVARYRLTAQEPSELDVGGLADTLKANLTAATCGNPLLRERLLKRGGAFRGIFEDRYGAEVTRAEVSWQDCLRRAAGGTTGD